VWGNVEQDGLRKPTEARSKNSSKILPSVISISDCAVFTPNPSRVEYVKEMTKKLNAEGVIHYSLQFCHPYIVESMPAEAELEKAGIPTLRLETDYSQEDAGQLKTRIEAFVERVHRSEISRN